jgi:hypothetical protein
MIIDEFHFLLLLAVGNMPQNIINILGHVILALHYLERRYMHVVCMLNLPDMTRNFRISAIWKLFQK